ncbi:hypothetical protein [Phenylobacterium immobile]|uniref:hypothetical protein n=1 Tax=Phenylobacterium immobile TaxID=21 RepID=UPI000B2E8EFC|nr:hypothetical protein [Phenylobacterium immobile]
MSLPDLPAWLWVMLGAEAAILGGLTWRFGLRGLGWGALGACAFWFVLSLGASFLVSRLEGGRPGNLTPGALLAMARLGLLAAPLSAVAATAGLIVRRYRQP